LSRFAQQTRLVSSEGNADKLVAKFIEAADLQRDNESCELMLVAKSGAEDDVVYVTEVWSSESAWSQASQSDATAAWARDLPALVAEPPTTTLLTEIGGKGIE
jgi:quinol monooxygenase YgiN